MLSKKSAERGVELGDWLDMASVGADWGFCAVPSASVGLDADATQLTHRRVVVVAG